MGVRGERCSAGISRYCFWYTTGTGRGQLGGAVALCSERRVARSWGGFGVLVERRKDVMRVWARDVALFALGVDRGACVGMHSIFPGMRGWWSREWRSETEQDRLSPKGAVNVVVYEV